MQVSKLKKCTTCSTLQNAYNQVDCSIYQLIKNRWTNQSFNVDLYFEPTQYKLLLRLKRILWKRLYNQSYPAGCFDSQDIISLAIRNTYNPSKCLPCPCQDWTNFIPSSSTSTSTYTSSTSTTTLAPDPLCYNYSVFKIISAIAGTVTYTSCDGVELTEEFPVESTDSIEVCAQEGEISGENIFFVQGGLCL